MINVFAIFIAKYLVYLALLVAAIYFFLQPRAQKQKLWHCGVIALPLTYLLARLAGWLYFNPRPFVVNHFVPLIAHGADNGFPSDHTLLLAALACVIFPFHKKLGSIFFLTALLVGGARVFVGLHHWLDITASLILAILGAALAFYAAKKIWRNA